MAFPTRWEDRPEVTPKVVEDFKKAYEDHSLTLDLIAANFGMTAQAVPTVAERLGCVMRPTRKYTPKAPKGIDLHSVESEIEATERRLQELKAKKMDLEIRAERQGSYVRVYGLEADVLVPISAWVRFLKAGGPQKVRQLISEGEWTRS